MAQNRQKLRKLIENDTRGSVPATVSLGVTTQNLNRNKFGLGFFVIITKEKHYGTER